MSGERLADKLSVALATARATPGQRRTAAVIAAVCVLAFLATVPFVRLPLVRLPAFIPAYQTALFFIDLVTAALLIDQCLRLRSVALLVLACGYLFDALIIVAHTLSFPGAFAPGGLLGAHEQTTAWLYIFWHGGFSLFVIGYAILRRREAGPAWPVARAGWTVGLSVAAVAGLVVLLTLFATWGHDALPVVMRGNDYSLLVSKGISPAVWLLTLIAIAMLWQREMRVMDLWLMLVMWVWLFDIALSAVLGASRFDLGFYAGRIFGLIAAGFLLVALLIEMARMYAGAMGALVLAEQTPERSVPARLGREPASPPMESTEAFIHQRNIAHYRSLLASGKLSEAEHRTIKQLLFEEERRDTGQARA